MTTRRSMLLFAILVLAVTGVFTTHTINARQFFVSPEKNQGNPSSTRIIQLTTQPATTINQFYTVAPPTTVYPTTPTAIFSNFTATNQSYPPNVSIVTLTTTTTTSYSPTSANYSYSTTYVTSTVTLSPSTTNIISYPVATTAGMPDFAISTSSIVNLPQGGQASISITVQSLNGFSGQVMLLSPDLPSGVLGGFAPNPVTVPVNGIATSQLTLNAAKNTVVGAYSFTIMGQGPGSIKYANVQLFISSRPGCLIATATFGSVLAPEVQFLRNFRDNAILRTFAGSSFMTVFNDWYYSFSPQVAQYEYAHPSVSPIMRAILYPLIGVLHVSASLFSLLSFQPEFAALASGIVAGMGLGLIYLAVPLTILTNNSFKHRNRRNKHMLWPAATFAVLLGAFCMAEVMILPVLMMFVSVSLILLAITTGAMIPSILMSLRENNRN